jgi:hypothetical protein
MVSKVDDTAKSGTVVGEVEDDQSKLGRWLEYVVGPNC